MGHNLTKQKARRKKTEVPLWTLAVLGWREGQGEHMKTPTTASPPPAAVLQFPFGCLCKCGIVSPTVSRWIEFKYLDLCGKVHSLSFKSSFG